MRDHAKTTMYAQRGWKVVPLHGVKPDGTCTCGIVEEGHAIGKHPRQTAWQKTPAPSIADVYTLWEEWPDANVGIATGEASGFWVLDVDRGEALTELCDTYGPLPDTYTVQTGSGGLHFYFTMPEDVHIGNSPGRLPKGIDVRGTGGQVVAPESLTDKGFYFVVADHDLVAAPDWLLALILPKPDRRTPQPAGPPIGETKLAAYIQTAVDQETAAVANAKEERNIQLNRSAFALATIAAHADSGLTAETVRQTMITAGVTAGLGRSEVENTVESGIKGGLSKPREPWPPITRQDGFFIPFDVDGADWPQREWDDIGNAERLVDHYGDRLLWVVEDEAWAVYDGTKWRRHQDALAQSFCQAMIGALPATEAYAYSDEPDGDDPSVREKFLKFVGKQRTAPKVAACLKTARGLPVLHASGSAFDTHKTLLNCENGIVDLETGKLHEHRPDFRMMLQTNAPYSPEAAAPKWDAFLKRTQPDDDVRQFLQRAVGYTLIGHLSEQVMVIHHGDGANGKSVFLAVLGQVFGSYSQVVPRQTLLVKRNEGVATDIARMVGRRLLQTSETAAGRQMDEEIIKSITGGDRQVARHLYGKEFEFDPQGTIHYATNHLPRLTDAESIWRRLVLVKWGVVIPESERDGRLAGKIVDEEAAGVVAWALAGARQWAQDGLQVPLVCQMALGEYREDSDIFGEFLRERVVSAPGVWTEVATLYQGYARWCANTGSHPMTQNSFSSTLKERGYSQERRRVGSGRPRGYLDVALTEDANVPF